MEKNAEHEQIFIMDEPSLKLSVENIPPYNNMFRKRKGEENKHSFIC